MQLRIHKSLNMILYFVLGSLVLLGIIVLFNFEYFRPHLLPVFIGVFLYNIVCFFLFKTIEKNWDKNLIQKMTFKNKVVIANIKEAKRAFLIRDSGGKRYNLWEITVDYIDHDMSSHEFVFFEKLNVEVTEIPKGTVFMTNDDSKPGRKFIVPNVIVSHVESLIPIVQEYEKQKKAYIKYLNVYYKDGLVIETFKQSINKQKQET